MANRSYQIIIRRGQTVGLSTFYLVFNNFLQELLFYNLKFLLKYFSLTLELKHIPILNVYFTDKFTVLLTVLPIFNRFE